MACTFILALLVSKTDPSPQQLMSPQSSDFLSRLSALARPRRGRRRSTKPRSDADVSENICSHKLASIGGELTDVQADCIEQMLATACGTDRAALEPSGSGGDLAQFQDICSRFSDVDLRILLLGKYFGSLFGPRNQCTRLHKLVTWVVENAPEHPVVDTPFVHIYPDFGRGKNAGYSEVKRLWLRHLNDEAADVHTLAHGGGFFTVSDPPLAERFYQRAVALKPKDSFLRHRLSHLYQLWGGHEIQALQELERAVAFSRKDSRRLYHLTDLPELAFAAGDLTKAAKSRRSYSGSGQAPAPR